MTEQAPTNETAEAVAAPSPSPRQRKQSVFERKAEVKAELRQLLKDRNDARVELAALQTDIAPLKATAERLAQLEWLTESLRTKLREKTDEVEALTAQLIAAGGIDPAEYKRLKAAEAARLQEEQALWNKFKAQCETALQTFPEFGDCVRRIGDIPTSWIREIMQMENAAEFIVFLGGGGGQFLTYLRELVPDAALRRIRRAGYDLQQDVARRGNY